MDQNRLSQVFDELYIPPTTESQPPSVPPVAPSLIMQDRTTDTTHHLRCGCCPNACIHKNAWWSIPSPHVRPSLLPTKSSSSMSDYSSN
ncbi:hypothetical protein DASB73_037610 [Starmerella bacillaris]|uniref:Uncharacterized protein n=1 Tax=Starmerella bacillaris TaxID=1247836 RepID=A0AAV5RPZ4_STABA|nr:hypothetical protein DASB73_037610 [Starmerella bacillaris]